MKKILLNTIYIFMLVQMGTGSVYRLFYDNCRNEPLPKLIGLNVIMLAVSFLFSYLGYLADKRRGKV
jgi:predicted exporter